MVLKLTPSKVFKLQGIKESKVLREIHLLIIIKVALSRAGVKTPSLSLCPPPLGQFENIVVACRIHEGMGDKPSCAKLRSHVALPVHVRI